MSDVRLPEKVVDKDGDDLAEPTVELLTRLHLLAPNESDGTQNLVNAETLDISKWASKLVGGGGIIAATTTGIAAWQTTAGKGNDLLTVVLVVTTGVLLAVAAVISAWIVVTDVNARARMQHERYAARAKVAHDYFDLVRRADFPVTTVPVEVRPPDGVSASTNGDDATSRDDKQPPADGLWFLIH